MRRRHSTVSKFRTGLAVLVRAHPTLQGNFLDFLEALPQDPSARGPQRLGRRAQGCWTQRLDRRTDHVLNEPFQIASAP